MEIYLVGGAVRDNMRGVSPKDRDYVVVGSSPEEMKHLGYKQVGKDFPVFLHPETGDEYALARTERKSGSGHTGFDCEWDGVTIEEDLSRRDLTINSMALPVTEIDGEYYVNGCVIDPFNGRDDIESNTLRHTTSYFKDDPLRVLRLARFAAQLGEGWDVDTETIRMCREMFFDGKLSQLTPERVWKETEKALGSSNLWKYVEVLDIIGYLEVLLPTLVKSQYVCEPTEHHPEESVFEHVRLVIKQAEMAGASPEEVFAALTHDSAKPFCYSEYGVAHGHDAVGAETNEDWGRRWKIPNNFRELSVLVAKYHGKIHGVLGRGNNAPTKPKSLMRLFEQTGAEKNPDRFRKIVNVCEFDAKGRGGDMWNRDYPQKDYILSCLEAVLNVNTKEISTKLLQDGKSGVIIGEQIRVAKINAIRKFMKENNYVK